MAVVEFAVVAPFLVLLGAGVIEVTRAVQVKQNLTDAARSGCRLAIQPGSSNATVQSTMTAVLTANGITATVTPAITVNGKSVDVNTAVQGDQISIKLSVPIANVGWIMPYIFSSTTVESETLTMMRQG
jgi:Flp pilus assembly protein TadG